MVRLLFCGRQVECVVCRFHMIGFSEVSMLLVIERECVAFSFGLGPMKGALREFSCTGSKLCVPIAFVRVVLRVDIASVVSLR